MRVISKGTGFKFLLLTLGCIGLGACSPIYEATKGWGKDLVTDVATSIEESKKNRKTAQAEGSQAAQPDIDKETNPENSAQPRTKPRYVNTDSSPDQAGTETAEKAEETDSAATKPQSAKTEETTKKPPVKVKAKPQTADKTKGSYGLHLASYKKKATAEQDWKNLKKVFGAELKDLKPDYPKVSISGKGDFYRIVAGSFEEKDKATQSCNALKAKYQYCAVVKGR
ncbi:SPOR domain-containing protein [Kiloniella sp. b19]|uniref:SPOR domain-containing protein n=1 Tax=Kiloniella sp. GXU_MW_B19 TaxID=3141326 RepID=UPI0031DE009E